MKPQRRTNREREHPASRKKAALIERVRRGFTTWELWESSDWVTIMRTVPGARGQERANHLFAGGPKDDHLVQSLWADVQKGKYDTPKG
jgi:hypothetical protein